MDAQSLQTWLTSHADALFELAHLEPTASSVATLHRNLGESWFRDLDWNEVGYTFLPLAMDGGGGEVAHPLSSSR